MEKDRFFELTKQRQTGERVRVLFDLLMEMIKASPEGDVKEFWRKMKEAYDGEISAIAELTRPPEKKRRKKRTDDAVSVSN